MGHPPGRDGPRSPGDLRAMRERGMSVQQIMQITGLGRSTVYRRLERDPRFLDGPPSVSAVPLATSQRSAFLQA
ncbi:helix-turn-helix domain-containing protein [Antribacter soli]|uniref:helix-turn-helix domain-containing protein n=1 Tax=Antribacter soli TaxID=2910976 RepID=UPI00355864EE